MAPTYRWGDLDPAGSPVRLHNSPEELLEYYERAEREFGTNTHMQNGATMCRWWLAMIANGTNQQEVGEFLQRLTSEPVHGTAWEGVLVPQFREWARLNGFLPKVDPREHPRW